MNSIEYLKREMTSKWFIRYIKSNGVKQYKHFIGLNDEYLPSLADVAMALHESIGKYKCLELGIEFKFNGDVFVDEVLIGRSKLAEGKSLKDLTIQLWLEDVGQFGFSSESIKIQMDKNFGAGWFKNNVEKLITKDLLEKNRSRELKEYQQRGRKIKNSKEILVTRIKEFPTKMKVKFHYFKQDLLK